MAVTRSHGKLGSIGIVGTPTPYQLACFAWTCNRVLETAEGTTLGKVNRSKDDGMGDASGTFSCYADITSPIIDVITGTAGADVTMSATGTFTMASGRTIVVKMLITGYDVSVGLDGNTVVNFQWVLGGQLSDGTASDYVVA